MKIKQTSTFNEANAFGMADWLCTTCLWTPQNIQLRRLCHRNSWRAARVPKVLFTGADFVTLSFAFGLRSDTCGNSSSMINSFVYLFDDFYAPSMIIASSVTRIDATAHFINSNTRNVFKVLIFPLAIILKNRNFQLNARTFLRSVFRNKTADCELFSWFFYRRASRSPLMA